MTWTLELRGEGPKWGPDTDFCRDCAIIFGQSARIEKEGAFNQKGREGYHNFGRSYNVDEAGAHDYVRGRIEKSVCVPARFLPLSPDRASADQRPTFSATCLRPETLLQPLQPISPKSYPILSTHPLLETGLVQPHTTPRQWHMSTFKYVCMPMPACTHLHDSVPNRHGEETGHGCDNWILATDQKGRLRCDRRGGWLLSSTNCTYACPRHRHHLPSTNLRPARVCWHGASRRAGCPADMTTPSDTAACRRLIWCSEWRNQFKLRPRSCTFHVLKSPLFYIALFCGHYD
ncbi:unnamed protein product [Protopolystoma xenopodis]|uniref:Uncharacterized protein n=1 Tax=Protopolystoma xenopodis TaxID=117903 RepID=A0A3S5CMC5_9PLAT|nr:unnamed protein product [Protopolystoma xenopodis]